MELELNVLKLRKELFLGSCGLGSEKERGIDRIKNNWYIIFFRGTLIVQVVLTHVYTVTWLVVNKI